MGKSSASLEKRVSRYMEKFFELRLRQTLLLDDITEANSEILAMKCIILEMVPVPTQIWAKGLVMDINPGRNHLEIYTEDEYEKKQK